jgi:hypothetical protein
LTVGFGPGLRLLETAITWDAFAHMRAQYYTVVAVRTRGGVEQRAGGSDWRYGPTLGTAVAARLLDPVGLFLACDLGWHLPEIDVNAEDQLVGRVPAFNFGIVAGLRWIAPS